jgi:hypothetical protein
VVGDVEADAGVDVPDEIGGDLEAPMSPRAKT